MSGGLLQMSGIVIDLVHRIGHLPLPGEEVESEPVAIAAGGGFNAMLAAKRFGIAVAYGGSLGTGFFASLAAASLLEEGIPAVMESRGGIDQGTCVVLVDGHGERSFVSYHGAERRIDAPSLDLVPAGKYGWILLSGYSLYKLESARVFAPWLKRLARGPRFLFDPGPMVAKIQADYLDAALSRADWVSANAREAEVLSGLGDPSAAAQKLAGGRQGALVRKGANGCWLALSGGGAVHVPGFPVNAVDTNGAGDTHTGAFIAALEIGYGPLDAATLANAAAALSATRHGPATAPDFDETSAFLAAHGIRLAVTGRRRTTMAQHRIG